MKYEEKIIRGKKVRKHTPVVSNLIFVYGSQAEIQKVKKGADYLQYMIDSRSREKITVPQDQMQRFIAAVGSYNDQFLFLKPAEIDLSRGELVRVTGGEFEGQIGTFMKVKGAKEKRVVVAIPGVMAVAIAAIHPSLVERVRGCEKVQPSNR